MATIHNDNTTSAAITTTAVIDAVRNNDTSTSVNALTWDSIDNNLTFNSSGTAVGVISPTWTYGSPWETPKATKEELQKIMKNKEVQIEIDGVMKTCKLSELLETGYLTLKTL